jgi:hypothetical protein
MKSTHNMTVRYKNMTGRYPKFYAVEMLAVRDAAIAGWGLEGESVRTYFVITKRRVWAGSTTRMTSAVLKGIALPKMAFEEALLGVILRMFLPLLCQRL